MISDSSVSPAAGNDYNQVAALVSGKIRISSLFSELHGILERKLNTRNMFIALVEDERFLSFPFYMDEKEPESELRLYPMEGLTATVIVSRKRRWLAEEPNLLDSGSWIGAQPSDWIGVPIVDRDGKVLGVIAVQTYEAGRRFSPENVDFVQFVAMQLSLALQLHVIDREIAVRRIAALVEDTTDLALLYPGIHEIVKNLIPAARESFIVARIDRASGELRQVYCKDAKETFKQGSWPLDCGLSGYVASRLGQAFIYEDTVTELPPGISVLGERPAFWLGVPIRLESVILGVVMIQTYDRELKITRDDERTLEEICPHIASAIARTEMFQQPWGSPERGS